MVARRRLAVAALLAALAIGVYARIPYARKPVTSDEIALIDPRGAREIALDYETRSNPPLHRLVVNLPFHDASARLHAGQVLSWVASGIAAVLAFSLGMRLANGSIAAGFAAAMIVLLNPRLLEESTRFRSYAPWLAAAIWQWHALERVLAGRGRTANAELAIASLLLPWLHYTSVMLLAAEAVALAAIRRWRVIALFVPAALSLLPLALLFRAAPVGAIPPPSHGNLFGLLYDLGCAGLAHNFTILVPLSFVVVLAAWRKMPVAAPAAAIAYILMLAALVFLASFRLVRPPGALWLLPMALILLIAAALAIPNRAWQTFAYVLYAVAIMVSVRVDARPELADGVRAIVRRWPDVRVRAAGRPVHVLPDYASHVLLFELSGLTSRELAPTRGCREGQLCWRSGGVLIVGGGSSGELPRDALVISFQEPGHEPPPLPCRAEQWHPFAVVADCRTEALP